MGYLWCNLTITSIIHNNLSEYYDLQVFSHVLPLQNLKKFKLSISGKAAGEYWWVQSVGQMGLGKHNCWSSRLTILRDRTNGSQTSTRTGSRFTSLLLILEIKVWEERWRRWMFSVKENTKIREEAKHLMGWNVMLQKLLSQIVCHIKGQRKWNIKRYIVILSMVVWISHTTDSSTAAERSCHLYCPCPVPLLHMAAGHCHCLIKWN